MTCDTHPSLSNICLEQGQRGVRDERQSDQVKEGEKTEDERGKMKQMSTMRCVRLTFGILQQEENGIFRDDELPQLYHVGHRVRHDGPLSPPTITALPQTLYQEMREGEAQKLFSFAFKKKKRKGK